MTDSRTWVVGSDHGGVALRTQVAQDLKAAGFSVVVVGPADGAGSVDYPEVAHDVCAQVLATPDALGVLVCGTGQGMAISANKVAGIRAAVVSDVFSRVGEALMNGKQLNIQYADHKGDSTQRTLSPQTLVY
ncbi:MAG: RpiB/LacA/LacB family sugar-phosphate isomerase, partial [Nannocystaceae bacterium]